MKKQLTALLLAAAFFVNLSAPVLAAAPAAESGAKTEVVYRDSGDLTLPKLSEGEIAQLLNDNPLDLPDELFEETPRTSAPYSPGKMKDEILQAGVNRLNALRRIAGLRGVELDEELCEDAQYGAVVLAALDNGLSHYPAQPSDMDADFYEKGRYGDSTSNLYLGPVLTDAVDGFMDDSDSSNIDRVGHRRWQLNPSMSYVGFGQALEKGSIRRYTAEKVISRKNNASCDYDFIAWPASGNFPTSQFGSDIAWSVSVNLDKFQTPQQEDIKVTLTRQSDGKTWTFSDASSNGYFNVDTGGYAVANCIIFRPSGISSYHGVYTVHIDGLKTLSGKEVTDFDYKVNFFNAGQSSSWGGSSGNIGNTGSTGNTGNTGSTGSISGNTQSGDDGIATALLIGGAAVLGVVVVANVLEAVQSMPVEVKGAVTLEDGTPLEGVVLTLTKNGRIAAQTTTAADGTFVFEKVERGSYLLSAELYTEGGYYNITCSLNAPAEDLHFVF